MEKGYHEKIREKKMTMYSKRSQNLGFDDRDELGLLEKRVLAALDPPLNLQGMTSTPLRRRLKYLRGVVTKKT